MVMPQASSSEDLADRLPPGQYAARDFPVLHVGSVPPFDAKKWRFTIGGEVERPQTMTWQQFSALPTKIVRTDIHCVTRWTKFDTTWEGVSFADIAKIAGVKPPAKFVVTNGANGYSANLPLSVALDDDVLFAHTYDGKPLEPIHGGPLRMFVPKRYFWKSTKWCYGVEFSAVDQPGFWEVRGYHNNGDPWKEERYW
jgi:DMSO/TMAO reductase YedYZ molybdopterin-dependent catalytic subunit